MERFDYARFLTHVEIKSMDECWEWKAGKNQYGYGMFACYREDGSPAPRGAHKVAYMAHTGREVPKGMVVMHVCDNRACVNPAHLRLGTAQDNLADMRAKGRAKLPPNASGWAAAKPAPPQAPPDLTPLQLKLWRQGNMIAK